LKDDIHTGIEELRDGSLVIAKIVAKSIITAKGAR
jgi:hypothetical protein